VVEQDFTPAANGGEALKGEARRLRVDWGESKQLHRSHVIGDGPER
jgi:hypothetical protein